MEKMASMRIMSEKKYSGQFKGPKMPITNFFNPK